MNPKVLIAGVGNIFLGDDGFGVEVANRLAGAELPDWARVADYGIAGDGNDVLVGMQPDVVVGMLGMLSAEVRQVPIVGCESAAVEYGIGLSEPVAAAVDEAVRLVRELIADPAESADGHLLVTRERAHVPRDSG